MGGRERRVCEGGMEGGREGCVREGRLKGEGRIYQVSTRNVHGHRFIEETFEV